MIDINPTLSIITSCVNGLNTSIKRQIVRVDWETTNRTQLYVVYKKHTLNNKDPDRLKVKGWRKQYHANINHKKADVILLITNKIDLKDDYQKDKVLTIH